MITDPPENTEILIQRSAERESYLNGKGYLLAEFLRDGLRKLGLDEVEPSRC